ncbi:cannabinoid receptor 2 isoform X2 [Denticeps clupeoides]|uniref:G-protein coupled receptors family 1 profile domain-containing protein n=2 Tax=Denticeps clupeoides TaxID=299321 RepID=A0AAY4BH51_9TELE|nr:cannabinoid receptor 2-like isoform X2 [Denticeps clupeoides]
MEGSSFNSNDCSCIRAPGNETFGTLKCYHVLTTEEKTAIGSICYVMGPITLLENILVLGVIGSSVTLRRRPTYLFIASLALADAIASCFFTTSFLDFHLFSRRDAPGAYLFKLGGVTMAFTGSVGSLLLTALDRYLCIYQASSYKVLLTRQRACMGLLALWSITTIISFIPLMGWRCPTMLKPPCSSLFPYIDHHYLACWVGFILVLLTLIVVAYALILWKAHKHAASVNGIHGASLPHCGQARMRMDIHLAQTLSLILMILVGCWLPVLTFMLVDVSVCLTVFQQRAFAFCSTLCLVNSGVNPLLYALRCRELRGALLCGLQKLCSKWGSSIPCSRQRSCRLPEDDGGHEEGNSNTTNIAFCTVSEEVKQKETNNE